MPSHAAHDPVLAESAAVHTLTTQRGCAPEPGHAPTDARPPNCLTERKSEEGKNLAKHLAYLLTLPPLSLMCLQVDDAELLTKFLETNSPKWFCHYIRQLIVGVDMPDGDLPCLDALSDEVKARLNVFAPAVKHRILAQLNRRLVVDEQRSSRRRFAVETPEQLTKPD